MADNEQGKEMPVVGVNSAIQYWWTCTKCGHVTEDTVPEEIPKLVKCEECELVHKV